MLLDSTEERSRQALALGWIAPHSSTRWKISPPILFVGGLVDQAYSVNGGSRYTLTLLEEAYELFDREQNTLVMVRNIPTIQRAAELLDRYGLPVRKTIQAQIVDALMVPEHEERDDHLEAQDTSQAHLDDLRGPIRSPANF